MQQCSFLSSVNGEVYLINCEIQKAHVLIGLGYFNGGLPTAIQLFDEFNRLACTVAIPDHIRRNQTATLLTSPNDDIALPLVLEPQSCA